MRVRLIVLLLSAAAVATACAVPRPSGDASPPGGPGGAPTGQAASVDPAGTDPADPPVESTGPATDPPGATDAPAPTDEPTEEPTVTDEPPATEAPTASIAVGSADACTGNDANRDFFADVAAAVDWMVLCAVLPNGWAVSAGSYNLASGGRLVITYKGPAGATLTLSEGVFCADASGCVPSGTDTGDAALGPMAGTLVSLDDGGWAIVVDRGARRSWLLEIHGLDEPATVSIGAALAAVEG